ncbi:hypothetical protein HDV02_006306 [Globomyces sp. JEL0801]|nr:hypothetical protein HDV02_006306 [Globomyces sp. JEL0801]
MELLRIIVLFSVGFCRPFSDTNATPSMPQNMEENSTVEIFPTKTVDTDVKAGVHVIQAISQDMVDKSESSTRDPGGPPGMYTLLQRRQFPTRDPGGAPGEILQRRSPSPTRLPGGPVGIVEHELERRDDTTREIGGPEGNFTRLKRAEPTRDPGGSNGRVIERRTPTSSRAPGGPVGEMETELKRRKFGVSEGNDIKAKRAEPTRDTGGPSGSAMDKLDQNSTGGADGSVDIGNMEKRLDNQRFLNHHFLKARAEPTRDPGGPQGSATSIKKVTYIGSGCPSGSVEGSLAEDKSKFDLKFKNIMAMSGPNVPLVESQKSCDIAVDLQYPSGYSYAITSIDYKGNVNLPSGLIVAHSASLSFGTESLMKSKAQLSGPIVTDYNLVDTMAQANYVWSRCESPSPNLIKSSVILEGNLSLPGRLTVNSKDGILTQTLIALVVKYLICILSLSIVGPTWKIEHGPYKDFTISNQSTGMSSVGSSLLISFLLDFGIQFVFFVISAILKTERFYDLSGAITYISCVLVAMIYRPNDTNNGVINLSVRQLILGIMVLIWSSRLGIFLFMRVLKHTDKRFDELKTNPVVWIYFTAFPVYLIIGNPASSQAALGWSDIVGIVIWIFGFTVEAVADAQKTAFKVSILHFNIVRISIQKTLLQLGYGSIPDMPIILVKLLYGMKIFTDNRYGVWILSAAGIVEGWQWISVISPLFVTGLLVFGSGVALSEKGANERYGHREDFQVYKAKTSKFFLWFPKKDAVINNPIPEEQA